MELYSLATTPDFNEPHSLAIRIWHWMLFLLIACSITTVGMATFVFRTGRNIPLVQQQLQQKGISVDESAARAVSHAFNDKLWIWHTWFGYGIAALVLARIILELFQPDEEKLRIKIRRALGFAASSHEQQQEKRHYLGIKWTYVLFYALILTMALTGLGLAFEDVPFFRGIRGGIKSIHSFTQYLIYGFILFHLAGVIRAENRRHPGLVSGMINGRKRA
jgi:cytochrome b